jgi:hypothetical protein
MTVAVREGQKSSSAGSLSERVSELDRRIRAASDQAATAYGLEPVPQERDYPWDGANLRALVTVLEMDTPPLGGRIVEDTWEHRRYFHHFSDEGEHRGSIYIEWNPETGHRVIQRLFAEDFGDDYEFPEQGSREIALLVKAAVERSGITAQSLRDELAEGG